jgi:hypothetical protein
MEYIAKYKKYKKKYVNKIIGGANPPPGAPGSGFRFKHEKPKVPRQGVPVPRQEVPPQHEVPVPQQEKIPRNMTCRERWFTNFDFTPHTALRTPSEWLTYFFPDGTYFQLDHRIVTENEDIKKNKKMTVTDLQKLMVQCQISYPRRDIADFKKGMGWS